MGYLPWLFLTIFALFILIYHLQFWIVRGETLELWGYFFEVFVRQPENKTAQLMSGFVIYNDLHERNEIPRSGILYEAAPALSPSSGRPQRENRQG